MTSSPPHGRTNRDLDDDSRTDVPVGATHRLRRDRCPGVFRPWPAHDGLLTRLRVPGGQLAADQLRALSRIATRFGDDHVHLTSRANLQLRGLPEGEPGQLSAPAVEALLATGLLPSPRHDLVRNILVSPATGLDRLGQVDLRPVTEDLDRRLQAEPLAAELPGRFLFVLDDGRGDLVTRTCDLGAVALDDRSAQLRIGARWGPVLDWSLVPATLVLLARTFGARRGTRTDAPWHVAEFEESGRRLSQGLAAPTAADPRLPRPCAALPPGQYPDYEHVAVPDTGLDPPAVAELTARSPHLVLTPWRGVLVPRHPMTPPPLTSQESR